MLLVLSSKNGFVFKYENLPAISAFSGLIAVAIQN